MQFTLQLLNASCRESFNFKFSLNNLSFMRQSVTFTRSYLTLGNIILMNPYAGMNLSSEFSAFTSFFLNLYFVYMYIFHVFCGGPHGRIADWLNVFYPHKKINAGLICTLQCI